MGDKEVGGSSVDAISLDDVKAVLHDSSVFSNKKPRKYLDAAFVYNELSSFAQEIELALSDLDVVVVHSGEGVSQYSIDRCYRKIESVKPLFVNSVDQEAVKVCVVGPSCLDILTNYFVPNLQDNKVETM